MKQISIQEAITYGWTTFKKHPWVLIGVTLATTMLPQLVQYTIDIALGVQQGFFSSNDASTPFQPLAIIAPLASVIISLFLSVGSVHFILKLHDHHNAKFTDLFTVTARQFGMLILSALLMLLIYIPLFAILIVPLALTLGDGPSTNFSVTAILAIFVIVATIIISLRLQFSLFLIVDKNANALEALKESFRITKGHTVKLFLFLLMTILLYLLGVVAILIGILVSTPIIFLAQTHIYRKLKAK